MGLPTVERWNGPARGWIVLVGLVPCLAAVPVFGLPPEFPWLRSSGLSAWIMMAAGSALAIGAARGDRSVWVRAIGVINTVLLGLFAIAFLWVSRLPAPDAAVHGLAIAPEFELRDHGNGTVRLTYELSRGPVLLAFDRGHW